MSRRDSRHAVDVSERYADERATAAELRTALRRASVVAADKGFEAPLAMRLRVWAAKDAAQAAVEVARKVVSPYQVAAKAREAVTATPDRPKDQCGLLRDLFGPLPFREVRIDRGWLAWNGGVVERLARAAYEERSLPDGKLDVTRLAVLADALEEAACHDPDILGHLRAKGGVHMRGCWAVDLLLGRE
jgi:hypothetical protein